MTADASPTVSQADLDAARVLAGQEGISPNGLLGIAPLRPSAPTFAEYIPVVSAAASAGTRRVYGTYWNDLLAH